MHSWPPTEAEKRAMALRHCRFLQRRFNTHLRGNKSPCFAVKVFARAKQLPCPWTKAKLPLRQIKRARRECQRMG